jgi:hypothetical protein
LGLRSDISKGVGITTTIKSTSNLDFEGDLVVQPNNSKRSGSRKALRWNESERGLKDDSSEEYLPVQRLAAEWSVRKTTEVTTSQEVKAA